MSVVDTLCNRLQVDIQSDQIVGNVSSPILFHFLFSTSGFVDSTLYRIYLSGKHKPYLGMPSLGYIWIFIWAILKKISVSIFSRFANIGCPSAVKGTNGEIQVLKSPP
jgi:hypothetical protein